MRLCRADFKTRTDSEAYNLVLLPIANLMIYVFTCGVPLAMAYLFQWPWKWWGVPGRTVDGAAPAMRRRGSGDSCGGQPSELRPRAGVKAGAGRRGTSGSIYRMPRACSCPQVKQGSVVAI